MSPESLQFAQIFCLWQVKSILKLLGYHAEASHYARFESCDIGQRERYRIMYNYALLSQFEAKITRQTKNTDLQGGSTSLSYTMYAFVTKHSLKNSMCNIQNI